MHVQTFVWTGKHCDSCSLQMSAHFDINPFSFQMLAGFIELALTLWLRFVLSIWSLPTILVKQKPNLGQILHCTKKNTNCCFCKIDAIAIWKVLSRRNFQKSLQKNHGTKNKSQFIGEADKKKLMSKFQQSQHLSMEWKMMLHCTRMKFHQLGTWVSLQSHSSEHASWLRLLLQSTLPFL